MTGDVETDAIVLLLALYDNNAITTRAVPVDPLLGTDPDTDDAAPAADHLKDRRLAKQMGMGCIRLTLTPEGVRQAQETRRNRADPARRVPELRRRMMRWLYAAESSTTQPDWGDYLASDDALFLGDRFIETELQREAEHLVSVGLITSTPI